MAHKKHKLCVGALALLSLSSCGAMPHHAELRVEQAAQLVFQDGPDGAVVTIDGAEAGQLSSATSDITIAGGTHRVGVRFQGRVIYEREVFIEGGVQKVISLTK